MIQQKGQQEARQRFSVLTSAAALETGFRMLQTDNGEKRFKIRGLHLYQVKFNWRPNLI